MIRHDKPETTLETSEDCQTTLETSKDSETTLETSEHVETTLKTSEGSETTVKTSKVGPLAYRANCEIGPKGRFSAAVFNIPKN